MACTRSTHHAAHCPRAILSCCCVPGGGCAMLHACPNPFLHLAAAAENLLSGPCLLSVPGFCEPMSFPCPDCDRIFSRPSHRKRHQQGSRNLCQHRVIRKKVIGALVCRGRVRNDNVRRAVVARVKPFLRFLKSSATRQSGLPPGPVQFVPFANSDLVPLDVHALLSVLMRVPGADRPFLLAELSDDERVRVFAGAGLITFGWTLPWARIIGLPPVPCSSAYEHHLREGLLDAWRAGTAVMNCHVRSASGRSFANGGARAAKAKTSTLIDDVRGLLDRAASEVFKVAVITGDFESAMHAIHGRGIPESGYLAKLTFALVRGAGLAREAPGHVCMGAGALGGLAALTGQGQPVYLSVPALAVEHTQMVTDVLASAWGRGRPKKPVFTRWDVSTMLCVWAGAGFPEEAASGGHQMRAIGV